MMTALNRVINNLFLCWQSQEESYRITAENALYGNFVHLGALNALTTEMANVQLKPLKASLYAWTGSFGCA